MFGASILNLRHISVSKECLLKNMNVTEKHISERLGAKDYRGAFDGIVALYGERMYWQIRRIVFSHDDADDVLQNCYIKIWRNLSKFRYDSEVYTWIYRITVNESLNFLRKRDILSRFSSADIESSAVRNVEGNAYFNGNEAQAALYRAIAKLPYKQRVVFEMRYFDEVEYKEMSKILGTSEGALKASYHIAYNKIRDELTHNSGNMEQER